MDISIISINYNNHKLTYNFVKSVVLYKPSNYEIEFIIVDNCSQKEDYDSLLKHMPELNKLANIKLVRSNVNLGFGAGNMFGTQFSKGKYLAFINNDVLFTEDCFSSLVTFLKENTKCGVVTPQQVNEKDKPTTCYDYFHGIRKELFGRKLVEYTSKRVKREAKYYTKNVNVDFIQGCFMFFKAEIFSEIGGFDTNLFLYYEEMDVCYRLKKMGYSSWLCPKTTFLHLHGASTNKSFLIKKELKISQLYILRKNYNYIKYTIIRIIILIKFLFKAIFNFKYWSLCSLILSGKYLENSLKQSQKIYFND